MRRRMLIVVGAMVASASALDAQVMAPNASGVSAAHEHVIVPDPVASTAFWSALGGKPVEIGTLTGMRLTAIYILFQGNRGRGGARGGAQAQAGTPAGPSVAASAGAAAAPMPESSIGSVVEAIGFKVKNLPEALAKFAVLGVLPEAGATTTTAAVMSPERVKILLTQDTSIATVSQSDQLLMRVPNPAEAAAWYAKWFGAGVSKAGNDVVAQIPGMNLRFVAATEPVAGTRGRALDHIGFEVRNLQAFVTRFQEGGGTVNSAFRNISLGFLTAISFVTDPWGTYIELNEGYPTAQ